MTYPAPIPSVPPTAAAPDRARWIMGGCWLAAVVVTVVATFVPLYRYRFGAGSSYEFAPSGWSWNLRGAAQEADFGPPTLYGIPLVICAVVVLLAAIIAITGASARAIGFLGTGLLVGAVMFEFVEALGINAQARGEVTTEIGLGTWLLLGAAVLAIAGAFPLLTSVDPRAPRILPGAPGGHSTFR